MGCNTSKTRSSRYEAEMTDEAAAFVQLAQGQRHPVAVELLAEWNAFVDAQTRHSVGDPTAYAALASRPREVWANTDNFCVTHHSVDHVGKMFLEYIKHDLSKRGWGGNFEYKVAGVAKQGFIRASATVEPPDAGEVTWTTKVHYHSVGAS